MESATGQASRYSLGPKKRSLGLVGLVVRVLLAVVLIHFGAFLYERWRFSSAVRTLHAKGEPAVIEDFNRRSAPDPDNPVPHWRDAAQAVSPDVLGALKVGQIELPLSAKERAKFRESIEANAEALDRARMAAAHSGKAQWNVWFAVPSSRTSHRGLSEQWRLARFLGIAAIEAHERGDDRTSLEIVGQVLAQQAALFQYPDQSGHVLALEVGYVVLAALEKIAPELNIQFETTSGNSSASVEQVKSIIRRLADGGPQWQSGLTALRAKRMELASDSLNLMADEPRLLSRYWGSWCWNPIGYYTSAEILIRGSKANDASSETEWHACERALVRLRAESDESSVLLHNQIAAWWWRPLLDNYRFRTWAQLGALSMALRLYEVEHDGALPRDLEELSPQYIDALPTDPMATHAILKYRTGDDPVVYSVGDDGIDDGGIDEVISDRSSKNYNCLRDFVVHLRPQARKVPPDYFVHDGLQPRVPSMVYVSPATQTSAHENK